MKLPVLLIVAFLIGFLPTFLILSRADLVAAAAAGDAGDHACRQHARRRRPPAPAAPPSAEGDGRDRRKVWPTA